MGHHLVMLLLCLGTLYALYLIAQQFRQKPAVAAATKVAQVLLRGKRDNNHTVMISDDALSYEEINIDWEKIMRNDPLECAVSLICQIAAGSQREDQDAVAIQLLIKYSLKNENVAPTVRKAYELGLKYDGYFEKCYNQYRFCPYSGKTMLKVMAFYSKYFEK